MINREFKCEHLFWDNGILVDFNIRSTKKGEHTLRIMTRSFGQEILWKKISKIKEQT